MHNKIPKYFTFINSFEKEKIYNLSSKVGIIYRNYKVKIDSKKIIEIKNFCKRLGKKIYLANDVKLAIRNNLDGVYIPSFNKDKKHLSYSVKKNFIILGSAHNIYEMRTKELQNVSAIFLSSIFKKNKNYLGINKFKSLSHLTNKPLIALGGISNNNIKKLNLTNCHGFAGITFFEQKNP